MNSVNMPRAFTICFISIEVFLPSWKFWRHPCLYSVGSQDSTRIEFSFRFSPFYFFLYSLFRLILIHPTNYPAALLSFSSKLVRYNLSLHVACIFYNLNFFIGQINASNGTMRRSTCSSRKQLSINPIRTHFYLTLSSRTTAVHPSYCYSSKCISPSIKKATQHLHPYISYDLRSLLILTDFILFTLSSKGVGLWCPKL